jgi:hypothetical protein
VCEGRAGGKTKSESMAFGSFEPPLLQGRMIVI